MNINLFSDKIESTKDIIVKILSEEFPLSLPKIKNILQKKFHKSISYQGIYKELNKLIEAKIVTKEEKQYMLNKDWILKVNQYSKEVYLKYNNKITHSIKDILNLKKEGDTMTLEFDSYFEIDKFFIDFLMIFNNYFDKKDSILMHYRNNWWPFLYTTDEFNFMNNLKSNFYTLCIPNSNLDNWACNFEKNIGLKVKILNQKTPFWSFNLFGDYVINYIVDEKIYLKLKKFFSQNNELKDINLKELLEIINLKGKFKVIFMKNSAIKNSLLNEIKNNF